MHGFFVPFFRMIVNDLCTSVADCPPAENITIECGSVSSILFSQSYFITITVRVRVTVDEEDYQTSLAMAFEYVNNFTNSLEQLFQSGAFDDIIEIEGFTADKASFTSTQATVICSYGKFLSQSNLCSKYSGVHNYLSISNSSIVL